ncbi:efflux RND transporter periplasmic adaptor subunit [Hutsoniella sourekii]|uniref:efflux RND transporter periplasmic adaptor subunit n=1 Tax=Hutsoniella sourekii TaxID=87650 RepID=UPI0004BCE7A8|nr:biotin/lipoyl-binding protein [Hutsoniella sourekii]
MDILNKLTSLKNHPRILAAIIAGALVVISLLGLSIKHFGQEPDQVHGAHGQSEQPEAYELYKMIAADPIAVNGQANLESDQSYYYEADRGKIESIFVKDGQFVQKGDLLFQYRTDNPQPRYDLEDAYREQSRLLEDRKKAIYDLAAITGYAYNYRGDRLIYYWDEYGNENYYIEEAMGKSGKASNENPDGIITAQDSETETLDQGEEPDQALKKQIREYNQKLEDYEIKIQRLIEQQEGKVTAKRNGKVILDQEGMDNNQVPLVRVISDQITVKGQVGEYDFHLLHEGSPVEVYVNAENRQLEGKIISFDKIPAPQPATPMTPATPGQAGDSGDSNPVSGSVSSNEPKYGFEVEVNEPIQPGFTVKVRLLPKGMSVPSQAIVEENNKQYVFIFKDGKAHKQEVQLEAQGIGQVVTSGLSVGDQIILRPVGIEDGQKIEVIEEAEEATPEPQNQPNQG